MATLPPIIITMGTAAMERRRSTFLTVSSLAMAPATGEAAAMARAATPKRRAREEEEEAA